MMKTYFEWMHNSVLKILSLPAAVFLSLATSTYVMDPTAPIGMISDWEVAISLGFFVLWGASYVCLTSPNWKSMAKSWGYCFLGFSSMTASLILMRQMILINTKLSVTYVAIPLNLLLIFIIAVGAMIASQVMLGRFLVIPPKQTKT